MKKLLSILCAAALTLSLAACGSSATENYAGQTLTGQVTAIDGSAVTLQLGELAEDTNTPPDGGSDAQAPPDGGSAPSGQAPDGGSGTNTVMYYIYYTAFKLYRYGYGNAMGVILALMIAVLSAVQFKVTQSD